MKDLRRTLVVVVLLFGQTMCQVDFEQGNGADFEEGRFLGLLKKPKIVETHNNYVPYPVAVPVAVPVPVYGYQSYGKFGFNKGFGHGFGKSFDSGYGQGYYPGYGYPYQYSNYGSGVDGYGFGNTLGYFK